MKTLKTIFYLFALLICLWQCTGPEPKARSWQSFIPEGYTLGDSVRGYLNLDSIPDFLLLLDSIAPPEIAPRRLVLLLYGLGGGKFKLETSSLNLLYDRHSGGVSCPEPYSGTWIDKGKGRFSIEQQTGTARFRRIVTITFTLDSTDEKWYLDRMGLVIYNPQDSLLLPENEGGWVRDRNDFGRVLLNDFEIAAFDFDEYETGDNNDEFIDYNFFKTSKLTLSSKGDELDSIAALKALFPGKFFRDFDRDENENVVFWLCKNCPQTTLSQQLLLEEDAGKVLFPDDASNFTNLLSVLSFDQGGIRHKALFFTTTPDYRKIVRFDPGVLGIAIFKKGIDNWELTAFHPGVTANGSFKTARAPQSVIPAGKQTFFELDGGSSDAAGTIYSHDSKYIFGVNRSGIPAVLLHDPYSSCVSPESEPLTRWTTETVVLPGNSLFPDLMLVKKGHYNSDDMYDDLWLMIPWFKKLLRQHPGQDSFDFKVERRFRFNGKKYVPVK